jgi:hypothetical protein
MEMHLGQDPTRKEKETSLVAEPEGSTPDTILSQFAQPTVLTIYFPKWNLR